MLRARDWSMFEAPRPLLRYILLIDLLALVWCIGEVAASRASAREFGILLLLLGLALVFEEAARRAARLQLRLSSELKRDMTSVWGVAAAVALAPGYGVVLLISVLTYVWFRQHRPAGEALYRKVFNAAVTVLGFLGAAEILRVEGRLWAHGSWLLSGTVSVLVAIVGYTLLNRFLVTPALLLMGVRGRALIGSYDDNLIELATLCLGGLVALAALYQPWLAILVIAPMYTLQRGALV
ncbi:MAG TPA: hypothetical protein VGN18_15940, partial [Jatrophihabitans sp.]|nr:hypothetical protein [Jatrophihabitans sp.]